MLSRYLTDSPFRLLKREKIQYFACFTHGVEHNKPPFIPRESKVAAKDHFQPELKKGQTSMMFGIPEHISNTIAYKFT